MTALVRAQDHVEKVQQFLTSLGPEPTQFTVSADRVSVPLAQRYFKAGELSVPFTTGDEDGDL